MCGFSNVCLCVCVGFVMCRCFDNCVAVLVICVPVFTVLLYCSFYVFMYLFLFVTCVRTTATELKVICSKYNNNNNNNNNSNGNYNSMFAFKRSKKT